MKINLDLIKDKPVTLQSEEPVETFPVLEAIQAKGECTFTGPIRTDVKVLREFDHIRLSGKLQVPAVLNCSRCLEAYATEIEPAFTIIYRKGTPDEKTVEDELELSDQDLISTTYSGDEIDLGHEIEEQIAMEIPLKPLCSESCKGLCPSCGTNLNQGNCSCSKEPINLKFSALKDFKVNR